MKKYVFYWSALALSVLSLLGYFLVGNYVFELKPTGEIFDVYGGAISVTPYIYVDPLFGILGVTIQAAGVFLFCTCFGILAKYCKINLSKAAKYVSVSVFAICYIAACSFLFVNNFALVAFGDSYAIKEIWANAVSFLICVSAAIFGFCMMYHFKNEDNHKIYGVNE